MKRLPNLGDYIGEERITRRNTIQVDGVKVIFAATDSMKVVIGVQSVQHPEFFTVYTSIFEVNQGFHSEDVKKAFKKMCKRYRKFYSAKEAKQAKPEKPAFTVEFSIKRKGCTDRENYRYSVITTDSGVATRRGMDYLDNASWCESWELLGVLHFPSMEPVKKPINYTLQMWAFLNSWRVVLIEYTKWAWYRAPKGDKLEKFSFALHQTLETYFGYFWVKSPVLGDKYHICRMEHGEHFKACETFAMLYS